MPVYGLLGMTHGWARVLTVMSAAGATAARAAMTLNADVSERAGEGRLTQYHERRQGGLDRLVRDNGIAVLEKPEWDRTKALLGEGIYR